MGLKLGVQTLPLVFAAMFYLVGCLEEEEGGFGGRVQSFGHGESGFYGYEIPTASGVGMGESVRKKVRVVSIRKKDRFAVKEPKVSSSSPPLYDRETNSQGRVEFKHLDKYVSPTVEPMHLGFSRGEKDALLSNPSHHQHFQLIPAKVTQIPTGHVKSSTSIYYAHEPELSGGGGSSGFIPSSSLSNSIHPHHGQDHEPQPGLSPLPRQHFGPIPVPLEVVPTSRAYSSGPYSFPVHYNSLHVVYPFGVDYKGVESIPPFLDFLLPGNYNLEYPGLLRTSDAHQHYYNYHNPRLNKNHLPAPFERHKGIYKDLQLFQ